MIPCKFGYFGSRSILWALLIPFVIACSLNAQVPEPEIEIRIQTLGQKLNSYKGDLENATKELERVESATTKNLKRLAGISSVDQLLDLQKQQEEWKAQLSSYGELVEKNLFPEIKKEISSIQGSFSPQNAPPSQRKQLQKIILLIVPVLDGYESALKLHSNLVENLRKALISTRLLDSNISALDKKLQMEAALNNDIMIETSPHGVHYELSNRQHGILREGYTPNWEDKLPKGTYTLTLKFENWPERVRSIEIFKKNQSFHSVFEDSSKPEEQALASGETPSILEVKTHPTGAKIQIAGVEAYSPAIFDQLPLEQELTLTAIMDGYRTHSQVIVLSPGINEKLPLIQMMRETGSVFIQSDPTGASYLLKYNGNEYFLREGRTPTFEKDLPTGPYTLTLKYKTWPTVKKEVVVSTNEQRISEKFNTSTIHITSYPEGAVVSINGTLKGTTPVTIEDVAPGKTLLELKKDGYEVFSKEILISGSPTSQLEFDLVKSNTPISAFPYDVKLENSAIRMLYVSPGEFEMGAEDGSPSEKPVHAVSITREFWMSETEITQKQWFEIMGNNPSEFKNVNNPVENVSWSDALEFCKRLNAIEQTNNELPDGYVYSLPTEAQWEYACKSGTTSSWAGDLEQMAWCKHNSDGKPTEVAQKQSNAWGFFDMHGNLWEWCSDRYDSNYYERLSKNDPQGSKFGSSRVIRGGGWSHDKWYSRSSYRKGAAPENAYNYVGFRIALVPQVTNN